MLACPCVRACIHEYNIYVHIYLKVLAARRRRQRVACVFTHRGRYLPVAEPRRFRPQSQSLARHGTPHCPAASSLFTCRPSSTNPSRYRPLIVHYACGRPPNANVLRLHNADVPTPSTGSRHLPRVADTDWPTAPPAQTMDRLRVMSSARRMFNGPLRKARGSGAAFCRAASLVRLERCTAAPRAFSTSDSLSDKVILESPFGTCNNVDLTLPDYIWRNVDKWEDKPMIVSSDRSRTFPREPR